MEKLSVNNVAAVTGGKSCSTDYTWSLNSSNGTWTCLGYNYCTDKHGNRKDVKYHNGTYPSNYCGPKPVKPPYQ
ncbi:hypothetical protein [Chimaeribacter arupi]|uniref:Uncharacterized protein n=1 Tax=Chimaeribacter arupi TaxID=2060066 RepID=A0A2N5ERP1_9GAMM|nr:hypothetical protein [Chimaeribacter arupi]PLR52526.1 hypothetical protein CYR34_03165 [Chimaeribacter arupi]